MIPELKEELRRRNAKLNGRKVELVERYIKYNSVTLILLC